MTIYRSFIDGAWLETASTKTLPNINPANINDVIGTVELCTREEARKAVEAAYNATKSWKNTPAPARGRIIAKAARLMEDHKDELSQLLTREEGKTLAESRGELTRAINVVEFCAGESRRMTGETIPSELPANFAYTIKEPHGVVACITPWNFPIAIPVWKIAPALVAGNTVVFKPASITPGTAVRLVEIFTEAGIPAGVLNLVLGSGSDVGDEIVNHPAVRAISFTGSNEIGIKMYQQAAARGIPMQGEMGGKNPVVVLEDADMELAVESTAQGAFGSSGQRCTATSRAVVVDKIADEFVEKVVETSQESKAWRRSYCRNRYRAIG
jgi:NAD-dependent aldehyde dehydrogenases